MKRRQITKLIKKIIIAGVLAFTVLIPTYNNFAISNTGQKVVVIEAGHGAVDSGSIAIDGTYEKDNTLKLAKAVGNILEEQDIKVIYTREEDSYTHPREIVNKVNNIEEADFFLACHFNASDNQSAHGVESYYNNPNIKGTEVYNNKAQIISDDMSQKMSEALNTNNRGSKPSPFYNRRTNVPSVLVEAGFTTNAVENEKIHRDFGDLAQSIAESIINNL